MNHLTKKYFIKNSKKEKIVNFYYVCEWGDTVTSEVVFPLNRNTYNRKDVTVLLDYRKLWLLNQSERINRFKNYLQYMMFPDKEKKQLLEIYKKRRLFRLLSEKNMMQKYLDGVSEDDIIIKENELKPINKTSIQVCLNNSLFWYDYMGHDRWLINFYEPISEVYSENFERMFQQYGSIIKLTTDTILEVKPLTNAEHSELEDSIILANRNK